MDNFTSETDSSKISSAREERRKTGRYIAVCLAIGISLLGLYQGMVQHTPVVAGLFAPAVIMFLYVFWVLWTASNAKKRLQRQQEELEELEAEKIALSDIVVTEPISQPPVKDVNIQSEYCSRPDRKLNRSYSIA